MRHQFTVIAQRGPATGTCAVAVIGAEIVVVPLVNQRGVGQQGAETRGGEMAVVGRTEGFDSVVTDVGVMKIPGVQKEAGGLRGSGGEHRGVFQAGAGANRKGKIGGLP